MDRKRNLNAKVYYKNLKHTDLILPKIIDSVISGFNMFVIQSENRDELVEKLREWNKYRCLLSSSNALTESI